MTQDYTPVQVTWAVAAYEYNASPLERAKALFPDAHPDYLTEWCDRFLRGFAFAVGKMDNNTLRRYVEQALDAHGLYARETV